MFEHDDALGVGVIARPATAQCGRPVDDQIPAFRRPPQARGGTMAQVITLLAGSRTESRLHHLGAQRGTCGDPRLDCLRCGCALCIGGLVFAVRMTASPTRAEIEFKKLLAKELGKGNNQAASGDAYRNQSGAISAKQDAFLTALCDDRGVPVPDDNSSVCDASAEIDRLLAIRVQRVCNGAAIERRAIPRGDHVAQGFQRSGN